MYRREPGDWDCNFCGNTGNFKSRTNCRRCGKGKYDKGTYDKGKPQTAKRTGDWTCPGCNFNCYAYKTECSKCKIKRPDLNNGPPNPAKHQPNNQSNSQPNTNHPNLPPRRDGDWNCPSCGTFQFSRNKFCRDCGNPKNPSDNTDDSDEDIGTQCVVCMDADITTMLLHGDNGHTCVCENCAVILVASGNPCPMCRQPIEQYIRNYQS